ncbi:MAG: MFS transporter [Gammaproteobacteria bacterium]|nr:MFS transporter [Gammaproteobacteria bacterium]
MTYTKSSQTHLILSIWLFGSLFYSYQYILRVLPNIMMPEILTKFHIGADIFGQFSGWYYIGYALMHIPIGIALDRFGPKKILPGCVLLTVIGVLPLFLSHQWVYPLIGRAFIGMGSSAAILGVFKIIRMCYKEDQFTKMLGVSVTIGLLGALYGGIPINYLMVTFGYVNVLWVISSIGVIIALILYLILPSDYENSISSTIVHDLKQVITNSKVIIICLLAGLMVGPLEGFADVWGTAYLKSAYVLHPDVASGLPSLIFMGMCFGAPILTTIASRTSAYYELIILSALMMGVGFIAILHGGLSQNILSVLFVLIGIMCAYQILAIFKASMYVSLHLVSVTTAIANMIIMTFGYVFHTSIGASIQYFWDGRYDGETPLYNASVFVKGLSIIPAGLLIAAIGFTSVYLSERKKLRAQKVESLSIITANE